MIHRCVSVFGLLWVAMSREVVSVVGVFGWCWSGGQSGNAPLGTASSGFSARLSRLFIPYLAELEFIKDARLSLSGVLAASVLHSDEVHGTRSISGSPLGASHRTWGEPSLLGLFGAVLSQMLVPADAGLLRLPLPAGEISV